MFFAMVSALSSPFTFTCPGIQRVLYEFFLLVLSARVPNFLKDETLWPLVYEPLWYFVSLRRCTWCSLHFF